MLDWFWELLWKISFWRLNSYCDRHENDNENLEEYLQKEEEEYNRWLHSIGYSSAEELYQSQVKLLDKETVTDTRYSDMFADWGL